MKGGFLHPSLFIDSSGKEFPEKTDSDSDTEVFFTPSGEGSGVTAKGALSDKHTVFLVSSLEGAFLSPLTTPDSMPKETVKKKKGFFERLSKSVVKHPKSGKYTIHKTFHSSRVVPGSPLRAPSVTPWVVPARPPSPSSTTGPPHVIADMAAEEVTVADLTRHLKQAFEEISLGANYPMPAFNGKKGENPDHCMKAEDYFKVYKIEMKTRGNISLIPSS